MALKLLCFFCNIFIYFLDFSCFSKQLFQSFFFLHRFFSWKSRKLRKIQFKMKPYRPCINFYINFYVMNNSEENVWISVSVRMVKIRRIDILHCVICLQILPLCFPELVSMNAFFNDQINIFCCKRLKCFFFFCIDSFYFILNLLPVMNKRFIVMMKYNSF